jgi:hypothetical protein
MSENTNRQIMRNAILSDSLGRQLTPAALERAVDFAAKTWTGSTYAGTAAEAGIRHVTSDVLREK